MDERRTAILEAAIDAFAERGYHGASTTEIARRSNVSQPALYYHFASKRDLLDDVVRSMIGAFKGAAEGLDPDPDRPDALEDYLGQVVVMLGEQVRFIRLQRSLAADNDPTVTPVIYDQINDTLETIEGDLATLAPDSPPSAHAAASRMLVAVVNELNTGRLFTPSDTPPWQDHRIGPILEFIATGLRTSA